MNLFKLYEQRHPCGSSDRGWTAFVLHCCFGVPFFGCHNQCDSTDSTVTCRSSASVLVQEGLKSLLQCQLKVLADDSRQCLAKIAFLKQMGGARLLRKEHLAGSIHVHTVSLAVRLCSVDSIKISSSRLCVLALFEGLFDKSVVPGPTPAPH